LVTSHGKAVTKKQGLLLILKQIVSATDLS